jgi:GT2 family glycosyltransferase
MAKKEPNEPYPGRFDENFAPYWYDDYDFAYRLQKIGKPIKTVFSSYIHHYTGAGITLTPSNENVKIKERNEAYLNKKHKGKQNLKETKC